MLAKPTHIKKSMGNPITDPKHPIAASLLELFSLTIQTIYYFLVKICSLFHVQ